MLLVDHVSKMKPTFLQNIWVPHEQLLEDSYGCVVWATAVIASSYLEHIVNISQTIKRDLPLVVHVLVA